MNANKSIFYHNPRCGKSRQALQLLEKNNIPIEIIEYIKTPPTKNELKNILKLLNITPRQLMRTNESVYQEKNLADPNLSDATLLDAMVENPILIERPIFIYKGKAKIGRPPEEVLKIIK